MAKISKKNLNDVLDIMRSIYRTGSHLDPFCYLTETDTHEVVLYFPPGKRTTKTLKFLNKEFGLSGILRERIK
jgi:repressor of nif and glnA expression